MQDQAAEPYPFSINSGTASTETGTEPTARIFPPQEDPISRLDRALQRISFALEKRPAQQDTGLMERQETERQELLANVDALILRVRDALEQSAPLPERKD
ncbi:MAG: hypothetical protein ABF785_12965 [Acetobacter papayae]|uniref:hypothetical protein n=1 Tax=Acetobacter papayae TaxID=1076592 RepID=UPI0039EAC673